jgi:hypothetical protein
MSLSSKFSSLSDEVQYPVTAALSQWDGQITAEAWERLQEVMQHDFFTADRSHGKGRIRPSSIGSRCPRPALLSFNGMPSDDPGKSSRSIMDAGTWRHYYWQVVGLSAGFLDDIEVPISYEPWKLKGSADGVGEKVGIFEFKSTNSNKLSKVRGSGHPDLYSPDSGHLEQVSAYQVATGLEWASLVYEDRNYLGFIEVRIRRDQEREEALGRKFSAWLRHIENDTMPPILPDCWYQTGPLFKYCGWKESCFDVG